MSSRTCVSSSTSGALRLAEEYLARGDINEAVNIYRMIAETQPADLEIKRRLGELCIFANQRSEAIQLLADVAMGHIKQGHRAEAISALNQLIKLDPSDPDLMIQVANLFAKCGLRREAERYYLEAADIYGGTGETAKVEAAYVSAAPIAPANAELQMKVGAICHRTGKLEDSYKAYMSAATEFTNRGDPKAALGAYGKAVNVALSGAEGGGSEAEGAGEILYPPPLPENGGLGRWPPAEGHVTRPLALPAITPLERVTITRGETAYPIGRSENKDDEGLAREIGTAEILLGLGRPDRAIALLKDLLDRNPNDLTIKEKLKDARLRSGMLEPAEEEAKGTELATTGRAYIAPEKIERTSTDHRAMLSVARPLVRSIVRRPGRRKYVVAAVILLAALGAASGSLLIRSSQSDQLKQATLEAPGDTIEVEAPTTATLPDGSVDGSTGPEDTTPPVPTGSQVPASTRDSSGRREPPPTAAAPDGRTRTVNSEAASTPQNTSPAKPTPPNVGSIAPGAGASGTGSNDSPSALGLRELPTAPAPATPTPSVRRAAQMGGGEVLRRVTPVYPQAARTAHITGTVAVEISINEQGNVIGARATSGSGLLAGAAEAAARGFKFTPATLDGVPVKAKRTVLFHFKEP